MSNFIFYTNPSQSLVFIDRDSPSAHSLEETARLSGVHEELLRYYARIGLFATHRFEDESELSFDEEALDEIRRIEHYRRHLGVSRRALPLVCELWREGERQQIEISFLRCPQAF